MDRRRLMMQEKGGDVVDPSLYLTFTAISNCQIKFTGSTVNNVLNTLRYSVNNGRKWKILTDNTYISLKADESILFKGNCTPLKNTGIGQFASTDGTFEVSGNIMSLLFGDNSENQKNLTGYNYAFCNLFYSCRGIANIDNLILPATTLADACYESMFYNCTGLTTIPSGLLPATTLTRACYWNMFYNCNSLTTAPNLPATRLADYCYYSMFKSCRSLTTAPNLPATRLATYCYNQMFYACTALTTAPNLPATTLTSHCYDSMFRGCSSLTTAPNLPATTLTSHCYDSMFYNCTKLKYIKAMFKTTPSTTYTNNWVSGVANSGTFVKNSAATWTNTFSSSAIPKSDTYKWTVRTASS